MYLSCLCVSAGDWLRGDGGGDDAAGIASHRPAVVVVARHGDPGDIGQLAGGLLKEVVLVLVVLRLLVRRDLKEGEYLARVYHKTRGCVNLARVASN